MDDRRHTRRLRAASHVVQVAALLLALAYGPVAVAAGVEVGKPAPDFSATTFDGHDVHLRDFAGHVLIINLWATWCGPCRRELPLLDAYYALRHAYGLDVIAVATEGSVPAYKLKPLAAAVHFPFIKNLRGPYRALEGVPTNYVIDRHGTVRYARAAAFSLEDLNSLLIPLLQESSEAPSETAQPTAALLPSRLH